MEQKAIELFYATNNKSKLHNMRFRLQDYPIKVLCPNDLNVHIEVDENGMTAVDNALHKASEYYKVVQLPTIAGDSGVALTGVAEEDQPGLYVRRVNGKVLTDDELIDHYAGLARKSGKPCTLQYVTGIALITAEGVKTMELLDRPLQLCAEPNRNRKHKGNPLDVVTKTADGRYFNDLSDEERTAYDQQGEQQFTSFVVSNLLKNTKVKL